MEETTSQEPSPILGGAKLSERSTGDSKKIGESLIVQVVLVKDNSKSCTFLPWPSPWLRRWSHGRRLGGTQVPAATSTIVSSWTSACTLACGACVIANTNNTE